MDSTHFTFIGAGNMAGSLVGGMIKAGSPAQDITVVDISADATERMRSRYSVNAASNAADAPAGSVFVIAVKPHTVQTVCADISAREPALVISVAAGVTAQSMQQWLPADCAIVRCMPNTPALLGLGATALYANAQCTQSHRQLAEIMLQAAGTTEWVAEESLLDAVTALSGSGPAYFFYLIEHMINAGQQLGLSPEVASNLAIETAYGAASMARARQLPPATLRENVTSKGGTTAAALNVFNEADVPAIIGQAMQAAHDRAVEMGAEFGG